MSQPRIKRVEYARARRRAPVAAEFLAGRRARQFGRPPASNPYRDGPAWRRWLWAWGWEWQDRRLQPCVDASTHVCGRTEEKC